MSRKRVACVGGIVVDDSGRLLLIRRGQEPARGTWSIPGGRVERGETDAEATVREVLEETGLAVHAGALAGTVERDAPDGSVYVINDYHCTAADPAASAEVVAGDDADAVGWFAPEEVRRLLCAPGLVDALASWDVLPPTQCTADISDRIGRDGAASSTRSPTPTPAQPRGGAAPRSGS